MNNFEVGNFITTEEIDRVYREEQKEKERLQQEYEYKKMIEEQRKQAEYVKQRTKEITGIHQVIKQFLDNPYKKRLEIQFYYKENEEEYCPMTNTVDSKEVEKLANICCSSSNIYINEYNEVILRTEKVGVFLPGSAKETEEIFDMEIPVGIITGVRIIQDKPKAQRINIDGFIFEHVPEEKPTNEYKIDMKFTNAPSITNLTFFILDRIYDDVKAKKIDITGYGVASRYTRGFMLQPKLPKEVNKDFINKYRK